MSRYTTKHERGEKWNPPGERLPRVLLNASGRAWGGPLEAFFWAIYINETIVPEGKMEEHFTEKGRFDSWKEISVYLNRTIRTCYRWYHDLGLPLDRVDGMYKPSGDGQWGFVYREKNGNL